MLGNDLRSFLEEIKKQRPQDYLEIDKKISPLYETAAIVTKLEQRRRVPILHFNNVKNTKFPVVVNTCASRTTVATALGIPKDQVPAHYRDALNNLIKPKVVRKAPVHEVVLEGSKADILKLPQMRYHNTDGASYISAGIVMAKDPDTGVYNASYDRLMIKGSKEAGHLYDPRQAPRLDLREG